MKNITISMSAMPKSTENDILWIFPWNIGAGYLTNKL
jgi:hypothetical protein